MWKVADKQHAPILTGLWALAGERGWEVEVVPLVAGQRSVREKEWLEALTFGPSRSLLQLLGKGIGPDLPASPGRLERRGLEIVGRLLRSRTSRPLYIYCKIFCANLFHIYLVFSPYI
jgi:hypothetical protein